MSTEMTPIEIIGLKSNLQEFLTVLRQVGCVHIDNVSESPDVLVRPLTIDAETLRKHEELNLMSARIDGLLEVLGSRHNQQVNNHGSIEQVDFSHISETLEEIRPQVQAFIRQRDELSGEMASLPLYEATLRKLIPLVPSAAHEPGNVVVGVLVNRANIAVLDLVGKQILELTHGTAITISSNVDESTRAMLIVIHKDYLDEVETLLGQRDVSRLRLPPELGAGLPDAMLETINRRLREIPAEQKQIQESIAGLAAEWAPRLSRWKIALQDELEGYQVLSKLGETDTTFILAGWVPKKFYTLVQDTLQTKVGETVLIHELPLKPAMKVRAPVILDNPPPTKPFESLVRLLELPRYNRIDPSAIMSLFLPIFFGLMLGDIGYGLIILIASLLLLRKFHSGFGRDLMIVIAMGSGWAILFGILFGEVFGTLGEPLGLHPIWMARDKAEDVPALLGLTVAIGAGHITLGLILGVFEAIRDRSRAHLLEHGGMLLGLVSLFLLVGVLVDFLPKGFMTPAVAGMILGIVLLSASLGWLGILMGPIEFIGLIGNVLSYLRLAAIGLASVYLAKVANAMAGMLGNIIVGLIVAVLIHALNLAMGVFSPTIHSLRLHYVEFFRKFYEGGGRPYEPFRSRI